MVTLTPDTLPDAGSAHPAAVPQKCYVCGADDPSLFAMQPRETSFYCSECSVVFDMPLGSVPSGS